MPNEPADIEFIRQAWREWNEQGVNSELLHPQIEWTDAPEVPDSGVFRGREDTVAHLQEWDTSMSVVGLTFEIQDVSPVGSRYFVISRAEGSGGGSGTPIPPHDWFHLVTVEDGMLRRVDAFLDREQALKAAGLSG